MVDSTRLLRLGGTNVPILSPIPALAPNTRRGSTGHAPFRAAWLVVFLGAIALLWVFSGVWASQPEMNDRVLIPAASAWLVYRLRSRWHALPERPALPGFLPLAWGALAFPAGWYLLVQVGPRVVLLWWLLASLIAAGMGLMIVQSGWKRACLFLLPLLFLFFALPAPDAAMAPLQRVLQEGTTTAASAVLSALGIAVERRGFVLGLPAGDLGVVEACSGVRSVTALMAIAVLVAYLRAFSLPRGTVLLALSFGIIVVSNAVRVIISGLLQEYVGRWAIEGWYHEALGILVVLVGLGLIVWTSGWLVRPPIVAAPASISRSLSRPARGGVVALTLLLAAVAGCGWSEQFRTAHREDVQLERLPYEVAGWIGKDAPIDPAVAEMLKCDQIILRTFTDRLGHEIQVYVMFWSTPASTAHIHHPDVCWPNRGFSITRGAVRSIALGPIGPQLPVSSRLYARGTSRQLVYYWTQRGNEVLPDGAEPTGTLLSEYAWVAELLRGREPLSRQARLSVLLGTDVYGSTEQLEQRLQAFTAGWAEQLYRLCPWALPADSQQSFRKKDEPAQSGEL